MLVAVPSVKTGPPSKCLRSYTRWFHQVSLVSAMPYAALSNLIHYLTPWAPSVLPLILSYSFLFFLNASFKQVPCLTSQSLHSLQSAQWVGILFVVSKFICLSTFIGKTEEKQATLMQL